MSKRTRRPSATWQYEMYDRMRFSRRVAWTVAAAATAVAALSVTAVVLVLPLKEFAPYVIKVERGSGMMSVVRGVEPGEVSRDRAMIEFSLVRYVSDREGFNAVDVEERYRRVRLTSAESAWKSFDAHFRGDDGPLLSFGDHTEVAVQVRDIHLLEAEREGDTHRAYVRFRTVTRSGTGSERTEEWSATVRFQFVKLRLTLDERAINPLGFQVTRYQREQWSSLGDAG